MIRSVIPLAILTDDDALRTGTTEPSRGLNILGVIAVRLVR
jgi:hypothetical protein